jgi:hypothetical protein
MYGNSAPLLNRKMSHELPQIIEVKAKPRPPLTNRKPPRRKKRRQNANAERMRNPLAGAERMRNPLVGAERMPTAIRGP